MASIYALLVGINDYSKTPAANLGGCLDDIAFYEGFLKDRFPDSLKLEVRTDADATRDNIIDGFRSHLSRAGKDDVALFVYAGHGARWKSAPEFSRFFPDGYDEGLVCSDSRSAAGKYDLADKELALLLSEVAVDDPHIAVILDSCHSGSATRSVANLEGARTRSTLAVDDARPLDSYLGGAYTKRAASSQDLTLPQTRHILLAACRRTQEALELNGRGSFSQKMEAVLKKTGGDLSYAELFARCRAAMRVPRNQDPQFETYGHFNAHTRFLGNTVSAQTRHLVFFDRDTNKWVAECGAFQNLPTEPDSPVDIAISDDEGNRIGVVQTVKVGMQRSEIEPDDAFGLQKSVTYKGEVLSLPVPPMVVGLKGDAEACKFLRESLGQSDSIEFVDDVEGSAFVVDASDGVLRLLDRDGQLIQGARGSGEASAQLVIGWLRQLVRFTRTLELQNRASKVDFSAIDTRFVRVNPGGTDDVYSVALVGGRDVVRRIDGGPEGEVVNEIVLTYSGDGEPENDIPVRFEVANRTNQDLHVAILAFTREYRIRKNANELIPPGGSVVELDATQFFLDSGVDEEAITFKFIVSTEDIDDQYLVIEDGFRIGEIVDPTRGERRYAEKETTKYSDEWFTTTFSVKVVRSVAEVGYKPVSIADGVLTIEPHSKLKASVCVVDARGAPRGGDSDGDLLRLLSKNGLESVHLGRTRGATDLPQVVELTGIQNDASLADEPLMLSLDVPVGEDETIIATTFDGEHFRFVAESGRNEQGGASLEIDELPAGASASRSVFKSVKLYFMKAKLGIGSTNTLKLLTSPTGSPRFTDSGVADRVESASNVLILIHGLLGDTTTMARGLVGSADGNGFESFDAILAYDYESLSTPVEETAQALSNALGRVGIGPSDGKKVTILAHGLGGLVARWYVEQLGGAGAVDHLIMCGTPNGGSPLGEVKLARKIIGGAATLALNMFGPVGIVASVPTVMLVLEKSKKFTVTLEQMSRSGSILTQLESSASPGVQYSIIGGDVAAISERDASGVASLVDKVGKSFAARTVLGDHHDVLASTDSIASVNRAWEPRPAIAEVACHHLEYFSSEDGTRAIREALALSAGARSA